MRASLGAACVALLLYVLLGQNAYHGLDAYSYLDMVARGELHNELNLLYQPTAYAFAKLCAVFGMPLYEAMRLLSGIAAALGVLCVHRAALTLGLLPARAAAAALGCGLCPAVLHAATVVEVDALLFAGSALAWLPFARLLRNNGIAAAVATGAATALAAGFHAAGHLLLGTLCGLQLAWHWPTRSLSTTLPRMLAMVLVHFGLTLLLGKLAGVSGQATMASNTAGLQFRPDFVPHVLWHEWLLPYAPFCVLPFAALWTRGLRTAALGFAVCLCGYLAVTTLVLGLLESTGPAMPHDGIFEFGSFLLGSTVPAVLLSMFALSTRGAWLATAIAALVGITQVRSHDWPADPVGYYEGYREVVQAYKPLVLVDGAREQAFVARRDPSFRPITVRGYLELEVPRKLATQPAPPGIDPLAAQFLAWCAADPQGHALLITQGALDRMRASTTPLIAQFANTTLPATFVLTPAAALGFHGFWVRPKP